MNEQFLAERFEAHRPHLRAVAYRIRGSATEADDALPEAWLWMSRAGVDGVENLGGWLTTIVARVCLNMLTSRRSRREVPLQAYAPEATAGHEDTPEREAVLADSVGLALLVVLDTLSPAERLAFVLHDMFAVPFDEIKCTIARRSSWRLSRHAGRQAQVLRDMFTVIAVVNHGRGLGVFYWEPTRTAVPGGGWDPGRTPPPEQSRRAAGQRCPDRDHAARDRTRLGRNTLTTPGPTYRPHSAPRH